MEVFNIIVLESDRDLEPKVPYLYYKDRWLPKLVFNRYKSDDRSDVRDDFSMIVAEFINFLSMVATCRIIRRAEDADLLEKMSSGDLMYELSSA